MAPIGELRIAIPLGLIVYNLDAVLVYLISVIGNLVPIILLLLFLKPISNWLSKKFKIFQLFFTWLFERTRKRYNHKIEKYGYLALVAFVAIPLPVTGGWTGAIVAFLFDIPFKKAFPLMTLGIMIAGIIVLAISKTGIIIEGYLGWQILISFLLLIGITCLIVNKFRRNNVEEN